MADSWIELKSDGSGGGTKVVLVLRAAGGGELRYDIPGVVDLQWSIGRSERKGILHMRLEGVTIEARATMNTGSNTVEDLITEIVAGKLARDKGDGESSKFFTATDLVVSKDGDLVVTTNTMPMDEDLP
jgi:hypothetical protein